MPDEAIVVLVTTGKRDEAENIANHIVEERLAACCSLLPAVNSIYRWQGKIHRDEEILMIIKTQKHLFERLSHRIKELHSYEVPEIIALPIVVGHGPYLQWISGETAT